LGIFAVAFLMKQIGSKAVIIAALITEMIVIGLFILMQNGQLDLAFLWLNPIGCLLTMLFAWLIQKSMGAAVD